jgi:hypothetical protein
MCEGWYKPDPTPNPKTPTGAWRPHPKHSATISPPRTNSRSALQGYPLRFWAPLRSAPSAVRPALLVPASLHQPVPPSHSKVARGPPVQDGGPQVSVNPSIPPFTSRVCSPLMWDFVYYAFPQPESIASSPARPRPQPVRPNPFLQPCPFGGPVLLFSAASVQPHLRRTELLRTMGVCRSVTTCNFIQGRYPGRRH